MGICSIIIFSYVVLHDFFLCNQIYDFSATPVDSSYQFLCPLCCAKQVACRDEKPLTWDDVGTRTIREPQFLFTISVLGQSTIHLPVNTISKVVKFASVYVARKLGLRYVKLLKLLPTFNFFCYREANFSSRTIFFRTFSFPISQTTEQNNEIIQTYMTYK